MTWAFIIMTAVHSLLDVGAAVSSPTRKSDTGTITIWYWGLFFTAITLKEFCKREQGNGGKMGNWEEGKVEYHFNWAFRSSAGN